ncbi:nitrile hydratase subunit beta [Paraburkholderia dilworthii]|uniref:nitrile hydratase subunit beta n=1 Tax=Paraburkholderia dilworthii TaxID=948106 RepID=UPI00040639F5|nr:nitrile hydratase subunit beta [Paraburkholderia dilworthii]
MDGFHDLGGRQGFGTVEHTINTESYKPVFKEDWEHLGYSLLFLGVEHLKKFSVDEVRHAVERIEHRLQSATPYFERYVIATASLLVEHGVLTKQELNDALGAEFPLSSPARSKGRAAPQPNRPHFEVDDKVTVRDECVTGHIRVPAYCRGKTGVILHRTSAKWPFPDSIGHGHKDAVLQPTYHVQFTAQELWGSEADGGHVVVDLFESYLDKAEQETGVSDETGAPAANSQPQSVPA